ncbi:hypothetical protein NOI24_21345 [Neorhizobium galegae]|uniref:hypothetical protein n=1 Tax=Neorhizobium galegae TaxID=399 RepID=UPI0021039474|nr:hypothetical protein [Neorhizobium galegae]MCQ1773863.1 hypothetical protein [Neorhizobium galegae]MCQ1799670.1 hypothetical protein [Neorhizobium galegae]
MAHSVQMIEPTTNRVAIGYKGFSWTVLFFGPLPALFRGHISAFLIMLIVDVLTFWFSVLLFAFIYNGWHYSRLLKKGFRPAGASLAGVSASSQNVINVSVGMEKPASV